MASSSTKWICRLLQTQLREDRRNIGAMDQPHLLHVLWSIVCDYVCEDPRILDAIIANIGVTIPGTKSMITVLDSMTASSRYMGHTICYKHHTHNDMYGEWDILIYLLMLPYEVGNSVCRCDELDEQDIEVRRYLYASIK